MNSLLPKIFKWLGMTVALLLLVIATLLGIARLFSPYVIRYQPQLETLASSALQRPVTIKQLSLHWHVLKPVLTFNDVTLWNATKTQAQLKVKKFEIGISLFRSLINWEWEPTSFHFSGAQLTLRQDQQGNISVNGIQWPTSTGTDDKIKHNAVIKWLLNRNRIRISSTDLTWYGKNGLVVPLTGIELELSNSITGHELGGSASLNQSQQPARVRFTLDFHGEVLQPANLEAQLSFRIRQLALSQWLGSFTYGGLQVKNGIGDFKGHLSWDNAQLQAAQTEVNVNNLALQAQNQPKNMYQHLSAQLDWQHTTTGWALQGERMQIKLNNRVWPETDFKLIWNERSQQHSGSQIFEANFLNIGDISQFLLTTTFLSDSQRTQLIALQPTGILHRVAIQHQGTQFLGNDFNGNLNLLQLAWKAVQKIPGVSNLTGALQWNTQGGQLQLNSQQVGVVMPTLFAKPLFFNKLDGQISWQKNPEGWQINTSPLVIENPTLSFYPKLQLLLPSAGASPTVNLTAAFKIDDLHAALAYMPSGIMTPHLIKWLTEGILSGKADQGSVILKGQLAQFPFDQTPAQGKFLVQAALHDAGLHYHTDWPDLYHINGSIQFAGKALAIAAPNAQILKTHLTQVKATFADLQQPILKITGKIQGDMQDGLAFLRESPLQKTVGKNLQGIEMQGPMNLDLALTLPLEDKLGKDQILGNLALENDTVNLALVGLQITQLQGALNFTEDSLTSDTLKGRLLNQPITLNFSTSTATKDQPSITQVVANGRLKTPDIQRQFPLPWWRYTPGAIQYQATLKLPPAESKLPVTLTVASDLRGLAINLPPPLKKNTNQTTPTTVTATFAAAQPFKLLVNYANRLSTALTFTQSKQQYNLAGGEVHLGAGNASFQTLPGLFITGQMSLANIEEWQAVLNKTSSSTKKKNSPPLAAAKSWLRGIDVSFPQLSVFGQTLKDVELKAQATDDSWKVAINSDNITGQIWLPNDFPHGTLKANFQHLYLQATASKNPIQITPNQIPSLDISADDFGYAGTHYGRLILETLSHDNKMEIQQITVRALVWVMNTTGEWGMQGKEQQTTLDGTIQSQNAGKMLSDLSITTSLASGKGGITFHLNWLDSPFQFALANLRGKIVLKVNQGRIINLKNSTQAEIGLGRVLNLLSLQTIPRRLRLDFSDLTDSGFAFDVLQGDFLLENGNMTTNNTYLDGSVAKVTLNGRIGLRAKDYDVALNVTPYVTSSLPLVATIAGGPIVGAATWVASKIVSHVVGTITTYHYRITGPWEHPEIDKLSLNKPPVNVNATVTNAPANTPVIGSLSAASP
jgi:uncharacterized protein (TIGR02099 family)